MIVNIFLYKIFKFVFFGTRCSSTDFKWTHFNCSGNLNVKFKISQSNEWVLMSSNSFLGDMKVIMTVSVNVTICYRYTVKTHVLLHEFNKQHCIYIANSITVCNIQGLPKVAPHILFLFCFLIFYIWYKREFLSMN